MSKHVHDWEPLSAHVQSDQPAAYDDLRRRCPVAYSEALGWSLFRHEDVLRALAAPETFSNVVSAHRSVPSGMDPPEHTTYRAALEPLLARERVRAFAPTCRRIARELLLAFPEEEEADFIDAFALPFATRCQCAFLGWPDDRAAPLGDWTRRNRDAILAADRSALAAIAAEFGAWVAQLLDERHRSSTSPEDLTSTLMGLRIHGQPMTHEELTSVLRNWTVGEVGSMAAALGILLAELARSPELQRRLRTTPSDLPAAIEELLRVEGPLVSNRRRVTRDVEVGGRQLAAGDTVTLMWVSANRDEAAFPDAHSVALERDQTQSLLWGAGIHVCPGAPLAQLELCVALEVLLAATSDISLGSGLPTRLRYPENGWASLPLRLERRERGGTS